MTLQLAFKEKTYELTYEFNQIKIDWSTCNKHYLGAIFTIKKVGEESEKATNLIDLWNKIQPLKYYKGSLSEVFWVNYYALEEICEGRGSTRERGKERSLESLKVDFDILVKFQQKPDIFITIGLEILPAHKLILKNRSGYLADKCVGEKLNLSDTGFSSEKITWYLMYIYDFHYPMSIELAREMLPIATFFQTPDLALKCENILVKALKAGEIEGGRDLYRFAHANDAVNLKKACIESFNKRFPVRARTSGKCEKICALMTRNLVYKAKCHRGFSAARYIEDYRVSRKVGAIISQQEALLKISEWYDPDDTLGLNPIEFEDLRLIYEMNNGVREYTVNPRYDQINAFKTALADTDDRKTMIFAHGGVVSYHVILLAMKAPFISKALIYDELIGLPEDVFVKVRDFSYTNTLSEEDASTLFCVSVKAEEIGTRRYRLCSHSAIKYTDTLEQLDEILETVERPPPGAILEHIKILNDMSHHQSYVKPILRRLLSILEDPYYSCIHTSVLAIIVHKKLLEQIDSQGDSLVEACAEKLPQVILEKLLYKTSIAFRSENQGLYQLIAKLCKCPAIAGFHKSNLSLEDLSKISHAKLTGNTVVDINVMLPMQLHLVIAQCALTLPQEVLKRAALNIDAQAPQKGRNAFKQSVLTDAALLAIYCPPLSKLRHSVITVLTSIHYQVHSKRSSMPEEVLIFYHLFLKSISEGRVQLDQWHYLCLLDLIVDQASDEAFVALGKIQGVIGSARIFEKLHFILKHANPEHSYHIYQALLNLEDTDISLTVGQFYHPGSETEEAYSNEEFLKAYLEFQLRRGVVAKDMVLDLTRHSAVIIELFIKLISMEDLHVYNQANLLGLQQYIHASIRHFTPEALTCYAKIAFYGGQKGFDTLIEELLLLSSDTTKFPLAEQALEYFSTVLSENRQFASKESCDVLMEIVRKKRIDITDMEIENALLKGKPCLDRGIITLGQHLQVLSEAQKEPYLRDLQELLTVDGTFKIAIRNVLEMHSFHPSD